MAPSSWRAAAPLRPNPGLGPLNLCQFPLTSASGRLPCCLPPRGAAHSPELRAPGPRRPPALKGPAPQKTRRASRRPVAAACHAPHPQTLLPSRLPPPPDSLPSSLPFPGVSKLPATSRPLALAALAGRRKVSGPRSAPRELTRTPHPHPLSRRPSLSGPLGASLRLWGGDVS